jgi:hypothetical protein
VRPARPPSPPPPHTHTTRTATPYFMCHAGALARYAGAADRIQTCRACARSSCYIPEISVCCVRLSRKKLIGYLVAMAVMTLVFTQLNPHGSAI